MTHLMASSHIKHGNDQNDIKINEIHQILDETIASESIAKA
jgi:hypothetical protein